MGIRLCLSFTKLSAIDKGMKAIRLLVVAVALATWSCEALKHKGKSGEDEKPKSAADIDTKDLPEEYVPGIRPVVLYYVDDMSNSQFTFEDGVGDYRVMLYPDQSYRFIATAKDKSRSSAREGFWKWHRIGPDQGILLLDNRRWFLGFTSLEEAKATTKGDERSFMLKFSHM